MGMAEAFLSCSAARTLKLPGSVPIRLTEIALSPCLRRSMQDSRAAEEQRMPLTVTSAVTLSEDSAVSDHVPPSRTFQTPVATAFHDPEAPTSPLRESPSVCSFHHCGSPAPLAQVMAARPFQGVVADAAPASGLSSVVSRNRWVRMAPSGDPMNGPTVSVMIESESVRICIVRPVSSVPLPRTPDSSS